MRGRGRAAFWDEAEQPALGLRARHGRVGFEERAEPAACLRSQIVGPDEPLDLCLVERLLEHG